MPSPPPSPWTERRPVKQTIALQEFRSVFVSQAKDLALLANGLVESTAEQWTQRQLVQLYRSSTEIETFLDDHGARRNRGFFRLREVMALVRWLSYGVSSLVHLHGRMPTYEVADRKWTDETLTPRVRGAALQLGEILHGALLGLREEWLQAGMQWPDEAIRVGSLKAGPGVVQLPNDRLEEEDDEDVPQGARLANHFLALMRHWSSAAGGRPVQGAEELRAFMANYCSEETARRFEARVHNLQSTYDTRIAGTPEESAHPQLRCLRGAVSQVLHLLEMVTALTHLYERHDIYERRGESRQLFERLVPETEILDVVVNNGVVLAYECMQRARPAAEQLLDSLSVAEEAQVTLPEGLMMHARPLSLIVAVAQKHGTPIEIEVAGQRAPAVSMIQLLVLAGSHPEERVYTLHGDPAALRDLTLLFEHRLGEDGFDDFPEELAYLRR